MNNFYTKASKFILSVLSSFGAFLLTPIWEGGLSYLTIFLGFSILIMFVNAFIPRE